jgi:hypothetical protein
MGLILQMPKIFLQEKILAAIFYKVVFHQKMMLTFVKGMELWVVTILLELQDHVQTL